MKILSVKVMQTSGADVVLLTTNLPPSTWPYTESPVLKFDVAAGSGFEYVWRNFHNCNIQVYSKEGQLLQSLSVGF